MWSWCDRLLVELDIKVQFSTDQGVKMQDTPFTPLLDSWQFS